MGIDGYFPVNSGVKIMIIMAVMMVKCFLLMISGAKLLAVM